MSLLLLLAGYIYARPVLEDWLGVTLPTLAESPLERDAPDAHPAADGKTPPGQESAQDSDSGFELVQLEGARLASPAGLVYGPGRGGQHRLDHLMRHRRDDPDRPIHGVFDGSPDQVLALIDEAYKLTRAVSPQVLSEQDGERTVYTVDFNRRIGYVGGRQGQQRGHPPCHRVKLVLQGNRVVTAYPVE